MERRKETFKLRGKHLISIILAISMLASVLPIGVFAEKGTTDVLNENVISEMQNRKDINEHLFSYDGKVMTESKEKNNLPMLLSVNNAEITCGEWYNISEDDEMTFIPEKSGNYSLSFKSSPNYGNLSFGNPGYWISMGGQGDSKFILHNLKAGEAYTINAYSDTQFKIEYSSEPSEYTIDGRIYYSESNFVDIEQDLDEYSWITYGLPIDESINSKLKLGDEGSFVVNSDNLITSFDLTKRTEDIFCDETKQIAFSNEELYYCFVSSENGTYSFDLSCDSYSWGYCHLLDSTGNSIGGFENYYIYHNMKKGEVYYLCLYGGGNAEIDVSLEDSGLKTFEISGTLFRIYDRQISETEFVKMCEISDDEYNVYCYSLDSHFDGTLSYGDVGTFIINENNCIVDANLTGGISEIKCGDTVSGTAKYNEFPTYCFIPEENGTYKFDLTVNSEGNDQLNFLLYPETESGMIEEILYIYVWDNGTISFNGYNLKAGQKYYIDTYSNGNSGVDYTLSLDQVSSGMSEYRISGKYYAWGNNTNVISSESEKARIDYYINGFSNELVNIPEHEDEGTFTINKDGKVVDYEVLNSKYIKPGMSYTFPVGEWVYFKPEKAGTYTIKVTDTDGNNIDGGISLRGNDGFIKADAYNSYSEEELKITYHNMEQGKRYSYELYPNIYSDTGDAMCKVELICDSVGVSEYSVKGECACADRDKIRIIVPTCENGYNHIEYYFDVDDNVEQMPLPNDIGIFNISSDNKYKSSEIEENSNGFIRITDGQKYENLSNEDNWYSFAFYPEKSNESYSIKLNDDFDGTVSLGKFIGDSYYQGVFKSNKYETLCYNLSAGYYYLIEVSSSEPISISFEKEEITNEPVTLNGIISNPYYNYWDGKLREFSFKTENDTKYISYYFTDENWQINNDEEFIDGDNVALNIYPKTGVVEITEAGNVMLETGKEYNFELTSSLDEVFSFVPEEDGTYTFSIFPADDNYVSGSIGLYLKGNREKLAYKSFYTEDGTFTFYNMKAGTKYNYRVGSYYSSQNLKIKITQDTKGLKKYTFPARVYSYDYYYNEFGLLQEDNETEYYCVNETQENPEIGKTYFFTISEDNKIVKIEDVPSEYGYDIAFSAGIKNDCLCAYTNDGEIEKIPINFNSVDDSIISELSSYVGPVAYKKGYPYYDSYTERIYEIYKIDTKQSLDKAEYNNGFEGLDYNITEDTVIYNGKSIEKLNSNIGNVLKNGVKYDVDVISYDKDNNVRALWIKDYISDIMVEGMPQYFTFEDGKAVLEFTPKLSGTYKFELLDSEARILLKEKLSQLQIAQANDFYIENMICYNLVADKTYVYEIDSPYSTGSSSSMGMSGSSYIVEENAAVVSLQSEGLSEFEIRGSIGRKNNDLYSVYDWSSSISYFMKSDIEIEEDEFDFEDGLYSDGYIKVDKNNHIAGYEKAPEYIDYNIGYSYGIKSYYTGEHSVKMYPDRWIELADNVRINGTRYYYYDDMPELNGVVLYQINDNGEIYQIFNNDTSLQSELLEYDSNNKTFIGLNYKITDDTLIFDNEAEWGAPVYLSNYNDGDKYLVTVIACDRYKNARAIVIGGLLPEKLIVDDYGKTEYLQGETLDLSDLSIRCQYQNGSTKDVTEKIVITDIDKTNPLQAGNYKYKVSYTENGTTVTTTIDVKVTIPLESVSVNGDLSVGSTLTAKVLPENANAYYEWYRSTDKKDWNIITNDASCKLTASDANNYIKVVVCGAGLYSGYVSYITEKVSSDTVKPEIQTAAISKEAPSNDVQISFKYSDNDYLGKGILYISADGGQNYEKIDEKDYSLQYRSSDSGKFSIDTTKYADGEITFKIVVFDKSGNESEATYIQFTVDNTAPAIPEKFELTPQYEDITLSWEAVSDSDFEEYRIYKLINDSYECISAQTSTSYKDTDVDLQDPDKEYSYYITAVDKRQNEGLATSTLKASLAKDTVKPVVQNIQVLNEYPGNAIKISSNATDDYEISKLVLEISTNDGETFTEIDEKSIMPNLLLQPVMLFGTMGNDKVTSISNTFKVDTTKYADGEVVFRTVAYDKAGNISEPKTVSFIVDNTGPSAPQNLKFESGYEEIGLLWDVDSENDAKYYKVYRREGESGEYIEIASQVGRNLIESGRKWTQHLGTESINVKEDVDYYYYIVPVDYRENVGTASEAIKASLKKDTVIPTVESINVINEYPGNAVKVKAIAKDDYKIDKIVLEVSTNDGVRYDFVSEKQIETSSANLTAEFEVDTTNYADGKIFFRALAYDKAGNISNPQAVSFTVDNTAPGVAENVTVSSEQEYNLVMWEKSVVEKDFMSFNIYRSENNNEFVKVSTQSTLGYYDTDTIPGKTYYYYITSVDNRRNESKPSKTVSIKRSEDTQKPEIVSYLPRTTATQYKSIPIQISVYDNFKVSKVKIEYANADSNNYQELTTLDVNAKSKVVSYNWDINSLEAGDYNVRFTAIDTAENNSEPTVVAYHTGTYTLPEKPVLSAQNAHRSVKLSWNYSGNNELISYYNVYRKKKDDANFVQIGKINTTSRTDSVALGDYVYKVEAVDKFGATAMGDEVSASSVLMDSENPTAVISNQNVITAVNETVVFNGSYSHDNDVIKSYIWDFGDGTTGNGNKAEHVYFNGGNYTVTLTVEDMSGNKGTAEIPVRIVDSNDDEYEIIKFTSKTSDGTILPYTNITVTNKETGEEINAMTDNEGSATVIITKGDYSVSAVKDDNELINQDLSSDDENDEPEEVELKLNRVRYLKGEIKVKELTHDEMIEAGIDTKNPDNMHIYEYKAEFIYESNETDEPERTLSVTYHTNGRGQVLGCSGGAGGFGGWWSCGGTGGGAGGGTGGFGTGGYYIRPLGSNGDSNSKHQYFLVISGEAGFLKQMFKVDLILLNESDEDWIENCEATLNLPDGLSFAAMTGGSQSAKQKINNDGKIDKNGQGMATWYVKGDVAGSYDLAVDVTGDYYPEPPENFTKTFITQEPVVVRSAKNSLSLNISGVPQVIRHGETVPITLNVTNTTNYDLYGVTMSIKGNAKSNEVSVDVLKAGKTASVNVDITFDFSLSNRDDITYTLIKSTFVCSDKIPTTVNFLDLPDNSELDTDITFYEKYDETNKWQNEVEKLKYACGSFSWDKADAETLEEPEKTNFDELNMKVVITNNGTEGGTQNAATNLKAKIKAPDGFSFNETEMKTEYTISVDSLLVGEHYEENVVIYPIYSEKYNTGDILTFESITSSDVHSSNVEKVQTVSVEKNENEGKIIIRDSFDSAGEHCWIYDLDMKLDGFSKPSTEYNHDLAKLSVALSGTVYKYEQSEVTLKNLGFSNIMRFNYNPENDQYVAPEDKDIVACEFATKKILVDGNIKTIVAVIIRGTVSQEWYSNFDVEWASAVHTGFNNAKEYVLKCFKEYINEISVTPEHTKLLVTGHSRAAAAADLLAMDLDYALEGVYASFDDTYVYTFAAPNSTKVPLECNNIFNVVNREDAVTTVPADMSKPGECLTINRYILDFNANKHLFIEEFNKIAPTIDYLTYYPKLFEELITPVLDSTVNDLGSDVLNAPYEHERIHNLLIVLVKKFFLPKSIMGTVYQVGAIVKLIAQLCENPKLLNEIEEQYDLLVDPYAHSTGKTVGDFIAYCLMSSAPIEREMVNNWIYSNHAIETYIAWMNVVEDYYDYIRPVGSMRSVSVRCPVDVEVYNSSDKLVAKIVNNEVVFSEGVYCYVSGEEKEFLLDGNEYSFNITGNDDGKMDISSTDFSNNEKSRVINYYNIPVKKGETAVLKAGTLAAEVPSEYTLTLSDGSQQKPDESLCGEQIDNIEISVNIEGNGYVFGDGNYTSGEKVTLYAIEDESTFEGWYKGDELLSEEYTYSFTCKENEEITAKFAEKDSIFRLSDESTYSIDKEKGYLQGVSERTIAETVKSNFTNQNIVIKKPDGTVLQDNELVGTGAKIQIVKEDDVIDEIAVVIKGDIDGDGKINVFDMVSMFNHIQGTQEQSGEYLEACLIVSEKKANIFDLVALFNKIQE